VTLAFVVGLASAAGAVSRYLIDALVQAQHDRDFPWGIFVVNVSGSLLLGLVTGLGLHHGLAGTVVTVVGVGFAGGYTTWSTYIWDSLSLVGSGDRPAAAVNLLGSLGACLAAAAAGFGLALL